MEEEAVSPTCNRMKSRNESFDNARSDSSDDDAFVDYDHAADGEDCLRFLEVNNQYPPRISADPHEQSSSENESEAKAETELQQALAYSEALVGENVIDNPVPREHVRTLATQAAPSFPCLRHHRSDVSSDDEEADPGLAVGLVAQGFAWVRSQRESRRRRYLQYQAEQQLRKIKEAQLAEKNSTESKGLTSNSIFQNIVQTWNGGSGSSEGGDLRPSSSHRSNANKDGDDTDALEDEIAAHATVTGGYTVELDVSSEEDDEEDATWVPPVRIEEEDLSEESGTSSPCLLNEELRQQVAQHVLPTGIAYAKWKRIYSLARDGDSFEACVRLVKDYNQTLLIVRTSRNEICGGFADDCWEQPHLAGAQFYGGPGACLFSVVDPTKGKLKAYKWTGANRYIQLTDVHRKLLAFGGGGEEGSFGLCVESDFQRGSTGHCETFGNDPLCHEENFQIVDVEIFGFLLGQFNVR